MCSVGAFARHVVDHSRKQRLKIGLFYSNNHTPQRLSLLFDRLVLYRLHFGQGQGRVM